MGAKSLSLCCLVVWSLVAGVPPRARAQARGGSSTKGSPVAMFSQLREPEGSERCQFCHAAEVEGYARSSMAHSLRRARREPDGIVTAGDSRITIHSASDGYWQKLEGGGEVSDYRIDYVIGSGKHAAGYLLDLGGHLFQSPVAYYNSRHAYDLAPGYEKVPRPDFTRPIRETCLFCHSGSPLKIQGTSNAYRSPPFSAEAITCERCHGSVERHLSDPRAGTIINPAKLEAAARDSICEQCHLLGAGRVLNPGKEFSDFRPGQRLEDVFTTYRDVLPPGAEGEKFKVISHVEQLARSVCARQSNGKLWCGTCHDPHNQPIDPVAYFRPKCLSCHAQKLPAAHPDRESNCIGCHMPRRDAKDGGHTAFTDHRIQRRTAQDESMPSDTDIAAWREPALEFQRRNLGIAYINVGMERRSRAFIGRGYRMLTDVQEQFANDGEVFTAMGSALLLAGKTSEAELAFERALQLQPASVTAETNLASAFLQGGKSEQATAHLERALALDPFHLPAIEPLIELYKQQGKVTKAADLSARVNLVIERNFDQRHDSEGSKRVEHRDAEAVYKNIQVLKDISPDEFIPSMRFISASLGVQCSYCHVPDHFDRDDKRPKQVARDMMRMMFTINNQSFAGMREVTCYSCHRGSTKPDATPLVAQALKVENTAANEGIPLNLPTADRVIDDYIRAVGGATAIEQIASRREKGITTSGGKSSVIEIVSRDPDQQLITQSGPAGSSTRGFDGREGWSSTPGRPVREMHGGEVDGARIDADLHFPLHIRKICRDLRVEDATRVRAREAYVVLCANNGSLSVDLYFDKDTKLLVRMMRYQESPLGRIPTQIDYDDYRDAGAVKIPFRRIITQADGSAITQLQRVESNIPIDPAEFAKPVAHTGSKPSGK
jgi:photosynthetic reaction center cytochrome c subunit